MNLIIVESPTKANTIGKLLNFKYRVLSSYGHIRDLPKSEIGINVEKDFEPRYIIPLKARKSIKLLKEEVKKADSVILATDEDREGEAIAWHLTKALQLGNFRTPNSKFQTDSKSYIRIVFHEITKSAVEAALKNPREIEINLVDAQQARRVLDRIVGYKLSPFLWKKVARGLSAGRVQSVAVRLVADREKEIEKFVPQEYWSIEAELQKIQNLKTKVQNKSKNQNSKTQNEFTALLIKKDGETLDKLAIKNKVAADRIVKDLKGAEYKVANVEKKEIKRNPLPPFTTSTLQQEAWQKFRWPAKLTMRIAQKLYETGKITYHRTDSLNLSDLALFAAKKFITENYGKDYWAGFMRKYKTKTKGAQEAHEAIRPSYPNKKPPSLAKPTKDKKDTNDKEKLDQNQLKLYDLIWRRFIACQMNHAIFDSTTINIQAKTYTFRTTGQILKFDGFLKVYPIKFKETELPSLEINEILELIKLIPLQHFTEPPPRYNEASLIKTLEENGVGRPSTYAPILSTIQERNYIEKDESRRFRPTEIGIVVNDLLVNHFPQIVDIGFTASMEKKLDDIAEGKIKWVPVIREFYDPFEKNLEKKYEEISKKDITEKPTGKKCPECKAPLLIRLGKFGKFYACSNFPKCRYTESLKENILGVKCPKCEKGEITQKRTKKNKIFFGCDQFPRCDFALWDKPTRKVCPKCKSLLVETKRRQIKCSNKDCAG